MSLARLQALGQSWDASVGSRLASTAWLRGPSQAQGSLCFPDNPGPWENMPRRATGGRQGGGTSWHHQTTAPGGRWQHEVEVPRAVRPRSGGGDAGRIARPLPARRPRGPRPSRTAGLPSLKALANSPWAPPPPPSLSSARGSQRERHRCSWSLETPVPAVASWPLPWPGPSRAPLASLRRRGAGGQLPSPRSAQPPPHHTPRCRSQEFLPHFPLG